MLKLNERDISLTLSSILSEQLSKNKRVYFPILPYIDSTIELSKEPFNLDSLAIIEFATSVNQFFGLYRNSMEELLLRYQNLRSWRDIVLDSLQSYSEGLIFFTKGTTGVQKPIYQSFNDLLKEAKFLAKLFKNYNRLLTAVRIHHIYGFLYSILLPKFREFNSIEHLEVIPSNKFFEAKNGTLIVSTPTIYSQISNLFGEFNSNIGAISSTEPMSESLYNLLKERGISKIYEIYGSSETLGVGYRLEFNSPYRLFDYLEPNSIEPKLQDYIEWINKRDFKLKGRKDGAIKVRGYKKYS